MKKFLLHIHPKKIDRRALSFTRTFGLGGISVLLIAILFATGLILRFSYIPTTANAYNSIVNLQQNSLFGGFIRNIHYFSAQLLVIITFLHLLRVYYSQAIYGSRAKNWIYGLFLFIFILMANFTGYILPWSQLSYWAITIVTNIFDNIPFVGKYIAYFIRGGKILGDNTLSNLYNMHTGIFPLLFIVLLPVHFWLVRKSGGIALPHKTDAQTVQVYPYLVKFELMVASIIIAFIMLISSFYNAPLHEAANPEVSPKTVEAIWCFVGMQELLIHLPAILGLIILPAAFFIFLAISAYLNYPNLNVGKWFNSATGKKSVIYTTVFSFFYTFFLLVVKKYLHHFPNIDNKFPEIIFTGVLPLLFFAIPTTIFIYFLQKRLKATKVEIMMMISSSIFASYLSMTLFFIINK